MPFKTYSTMRNNWQSYLKFGSSQISFSIDEEQSQRFRLELDYEGASIHMGPNVPALSSFTFLTWVMRVGLAIGSLLCERVFW